MAGWIKVSLGMEVGLGPGHIVLDRDYPPKGHPQFSATSIVDKRSPISATSEVLSTCKRAPNLKRANVCADHSH